MSTQKKSKTLNELASSKRTLYCSEDLAKDSRRVCKGQKGMENGSGKSREKKKDFEMVSYGV
jgi:hypothetical protein